MKKAITLSMVAFMALNTSGCATLEKYWNTSVAVGDVVLPSTTKKIATPIVATTESVYAIIKDEDKKD